MIFRTDCLFEFPKIGFYACHLFKRKPKDNDSIEFTYIYTCDETIP